MAEPDVILATIVTSSNPSDVVLFESPGYPDGFPRVHCLVVGGELGEMPRTVVPWGLEQLSLPSGALRYAMDGSEIATLVKARFLHSVARAEPSSQVLFVDETCWMRHLPAASDADMDSSLHLFTGLSEVVAQHLPAFAQALAAGLGLPTGDVIHLRNVDEQTSGILEDWDRWMFHRYLTDPTTLLRTDEAAYLSSLPGSRSSVSWGDPATYAPLDRLAPSDEVAIVGTRDCADRSAFSNLSVDAASPPAALLGGRPGYDEGVPVSDRYGRLARLVFRAVDPTGQRWPEPENDFRVWLEDRDSSGLSRLGRSAYWTRADLRAGFPPRQTSTEVFDDWFHRIGLDSEVPEGSGHVTSRTARAVGRVARRVTRRPVPRLADARRPSPDSDGFNVVGFLSAATGLGSAARSTEAALTALPARVASLDLSDRIVTGRVDREKPSIEGMPFDVSIFHLNPDELISYASDSLAYRLGTGWNIGFFFWETDRIPDSWREGIDAVDEIWVGSNFVAEAFRRVTSKEVRIVGLPVEPVDVSRSERLGDSEFVVSYVADLGSGVARKNPLAAVDAFRLAFDGEFENVRLVMKLGSLNRFPRLRSRLEIAARGMPLDIHEGYLGHSQLRSLIAESDVYLSLHRSEGLGLTMLEAMELGVPVVATGYGGNTEFMSDESGRLVDYVLVTAGDDAGPYVGHRWAEPDIAHAAAQVRELRADPQLRSSIGQRGREIVRSRYSADAFCARIAAALEQAGLTRGGREVPSGRR